MEDREYNTPHEIEHIKRILMESSSRHVDLSFDSRIRSYIGESVKDIRMFKLVHNDLTYGYNRKPILIKVQISEEEIKDLPGFRYITSAMIDEDWFIEHCVGKVQKETNQIEFF